MPTHPTHPTLTAWTAALQSLAQSDALAQALQSVYGPAAFPDRLEALQQALASGDMTVLPQIVTVDAEVLQGRPGAYSRDTDTVYVDARVLEVPSVALEVLTHEWAHTVAARHFADTERSGDAYALTKALLGQDHALILSSPEAHAQAGAAESSGQLISPGGTAAVAVQWFDTALHIDWAREQLPMLNAKAFDLFKLGQNDSDAFFGTKRVGMLSPYGLQTSSATHFDNNNVRGSIETMRKRWTDGLDNFMAEKVDNEMYIEVEASSLMLRKGDDARVGPDFKGPNAGLENLLYRFGQIAHTSVDFYSHSNWVEMVLAGEGRWIAPGTLLDAGLDLPAPLNPGSYLGPAPSVQVAMSGPDFDQSMQLAGKGTYANGTKVVHWWVQDRQSQWGEVFAQPKAGVAAPADRVGGLMTGAVNGAIYYDTDFSLPLRAVDRTGLFEAEYFRGFSHGGLAGTVMGQWLSPLSKDKPDNGRFSDKDANRVLFQQAKDYSASQVRHDFDRMGHLIFKHHGVEGLRTFAEFALVESARAQFVSTYSKADGRWDWTPAQQNLALARTFMTTAVEADPDAHDFHFDESNMRFIEVFHAAPEGDTQGIGSRTYLTQIWVDGRWQDAAAGLINTHHDRLEDYGPDAFLPAPVQHTELGGRALWSTPYAEEGHYLGTVYAVANVNTQARVHIRQFDIGRDLLQLVDAQGQVLTTFDLDHADYPVQRQLLLERHNIEINARPETEALTQSRVILSDTVQGPVLLQAADFFADPDVLLTSDSRSNAATMVFAGHDEIHPWLELRSDGQLEITDLSKVPKGLHEIYVSVSDGAGGQLEGGLIRLAVDPQIRIGEQLYAPGSEITLQLRADNQAAVGLWGQVVDEAGRPVGLPEHWGTSLGQASGLPVDVQPGHVQSMLASDTDHGTMQFFADVYDRQETVALEVRTTGENRFELWHDDVLFADFSLQAKQTEALIDSLYISGQEDIQLGVPLPALLDSVSLDAPGLTHQVRLEARVVQESPLAGEFGFVVMDLQSGDVIDPRTGVQLEALRLTPDNVLDHAVYSVRSASDTVIESSNHFLLDAELNLNNLALQPFYRVETQQGPQLMLGGVEGLREGISPIVRVGLNSFGVDDMVDGDLDFDDVVVTLSGLNMAAFNNDRIPVWELL